MVRVLRPYGTLPSIIIATSPENLSIIHGYNLSLKTLQSRQNLLLPHKELLLLPTSLTYTPLTP